MTSSGSRPRFSTEDDWYAPFDATPDFDLPMYVGGATFQKLPFVGEPQALRERAADVAVVGAPMDEGDTYRPGARFGPRAIRLAHSNTGSVYALHSGLEPLAVLDAVDAGDAAIEPTWIAHNHRAVYRKVRDVVNAGTVPLVLGGDHSISWPAITAVAEGHWPRRIGVIHFDAHTDTSDASHPIASHGKPMRRLIESGAVAAPNVAQIGLRGYWPGADVLAWMDAQGFHRHPMTEIEDRGLDAVLADAIAEATDGTGAVYLSVDSDVLEPALAPGTGTPEPGGLLTRELLRAIRQIVGSVRLAGADVVEVSPPFDVADVTATTAHRCVLECITGLAVRRAAGEPVRFDAGEPVG